MQEIVMDWAGRAAIVTGGASGIGAATAAEFARRGVTVGLFDINETQGRQLEENLRSGGGQSLFFQVDTSDASGCRDAVQAFAKKSGRLDYLVNNAASFL